MISKGKVPAFLMHLQYRKFECLHLFDGVDENNFVVNSMTISTDESAIVPHIVKYGGGPDGKQRALFILDGACSHKVEGALFTAACARNNIEVAIIPASSCTNEIQLKI